jgi:hypothetical protein
MLRIAGWIWMLGWAAVLYAVTWPWTRLGGLVTERMRWTEWLVLGWGLVLGGFAGSLIRDACRAGNGRTQSGLLRWVLPVPAAVTAVGMIVLRLSGADDAIGVLFTGFLAFWAGLDTARGAYPLACGESWRSR